RPPGKFDEKADDGFFLGYSLVAKDFRGDEINFNKNRSFSDDELLVPRNPSQRIGNDDYLPYVPAFDPLSTNNIIIHDTVTPITHNINSSDEPPINDNTISEAVPSSTTISPSAEINHDTLAPQDSWSRDKYILLINILGGPQAGLTKRSRVKESEDASAHECLYVNFLFEIEPKKFIRYIDTRPNGDALWKCILEGPYTPSIVVILVVPAIDNSPAVPEQTTVETILNMSPENKAHFESEKEAIYFILTGIGDEIYSTVDACHTAHEMWEAIERLQQGESLNIQDVKTNLFWEFRKFMSHDEESIESYYSRFYKLMNEMIRNNLTVDTMQSMFNFFSNFNQNGQGL
ncbi:hypothetical protein Tco_1364879, partial [Tanacetum coccineum]